MYTIQEVMIATLAGIYWRAQERQLERGGSVSGNIGERLKAVLEEQLNKTGEELAVQLGYIYPHITPEDARRLMDGLGRAIHASPQDLKKRQQEYIALTAEIKKKYGESED